MKRIGIIDLGSNSARLVIVRIHGNNSNQLIYTQKSALRLSQRINKNGEITADAIKDIITAMQKLAHMCKLFNTTTTLAVATAAIRSAKNGPEIIEKIKQEVKIDITIIKGEEEAHFGYLGVINSIDCKNAVLFDLGGGSLEIVLIKDRIPEHMLSLNIGATTMTEKFKTYDKMSSKTYRELKQYIDQKIKKSLPWLKNAKLPIIGVGGTVRNIAKIHQRKIAYAYPKLHNYRMSNEEFSDVFNMLRNTSYEERKSIPGLSSERADIILSGAAIINELIASSKSREFIISGCGLREGLFHDYYFKTLKKPNVIENILDDSIANLLSLTLGNDVHSQKVAQMSEKMFTAWQSIHKLDEDAFKTLHVAATLHDVGISINYYAHPRHSAYLIENSPLMGITHREQIMAALIANWHNGVSLKNMKHKLFKEFLTEKDLIIAKRLALILSIAENLDFTETDAIRDIYPDVLTDGRAVLGIAGSNKALDIELGELQKNIAPFKKEFKTELVIRRV